jgi:hypothetical protein
MVYRALHTLTLVAFGVVLTLVEGELIDLDGVGAAGSEWLEGNGYVEAVRGEVGEPETPEARQAAPEKRHRGK